MGLFNGSFWPLFGVFTVLSLRVKLWKQTEGWLRELDGRCALDIELQCMLSLKHFQLLCLDSFWPVYDASCWTSFFKVGQ